MAKTKRKASGKDELIRGFYRQSKAWYATEKHLREQTIMFGVYRKSGGTLGEMSVSWEDLGGIIAPRFRVFDDCWKFLPTFFDVQKKMAKWDSKNISEGQFVSLLKACGFTDLTPYDKNLRAGQKPRKVVAATPRKLKR